MALRKSGSISWYGGRGDTQDNNRPAGGIPNERLAQIAVYNPHTLGGFWLITDPHSGRRKVIRQGDIGPHPSTGRTFDFNPKAAALFGWKATDQAFPTGRKVTGVYLGKSRSRALHVQRQVDTGGTSAPAPRRVPGIAAARGGRPMLGGLTLEQIGRALAQIRAGV